jgi:hypothetical protein
VLDLLRLTATSALNAHLHEAAVREACAWPCERLVLTEDNLAAL